MTFPYDEGWFLMMLAERAKRSDGGEFQRIREAVEGRLLDALEKRPFPENLGLGRAEREAGQERYCGFYGSSLFLYLQLRWAGPITAGGPGSSSGVKRRSRRESGDQRRGGAPRIRLPLAPALLALADEIHRSPP